MNAWEEAVGQLQSDFSDNKTDSLGGLTKDQWRFMDWDTTPKDLKPEGQKTLKEYCDYHHHQPASVMKWKALEVYRIRRRTLSLEKGETDYRVRGVLDILEEKAREGNVSAAKEFLRHYAGDESAKPNDEGEVKVEVTDGQVKSLDEMSEEELNAWLAKDSTES